jgi:hypothetical protein
VRGFELYQYSFFGRVLPERAAVHISQISFEFIHPDSQIKGRLTVEIIASQISAALITDEEISDIFTLKNVIEDLIRFELDFVGFIFGRGYDLEITSLITSPKFSTVVFGVGIGILEQTMHERITRIEISSLLELYGGRTADYLRRSLSDLRESIKVAKDTSFFCYRAIESFMQYFKNEFQLKEGTAWEMMRDTLKVERDDINIVKSFADPIRHGKNEYISSEDREKILEITWEITSRFIEYSIGLEQNERPQ